MGKGAPGSVKVVASNKKAFHDFAFDDTWEAGIVLSGSEVKVLRAGKCTMTGAHVRVVGGEALLFNLQIPEYPWSHQFNHEPGRPRKLLLHKKEIEKLDVLLRRGSYACVATKLYFKGAKIKVELGLGTGKKAHDKRESVKEREAKREMARAKR
jgi:SsrA-binding protein